MHPELRDRIKVSGGVGFDYCVISRGSLDSSTLYNRVDELGFERVIGVGCWDFGCAYPEDPRYGLFASLYPESVLERYRKDGINFNAALEQVVKQYPEILFILKVHPGEMLGDKASGIVGIRGLQNVLVVKDEYSIRDCIAASDFWMVYESTSALEAWLLGKQTCMLNPSGRDFVRESYISEGSPDFMTANEVDAAIRAFYESGKLPGFEERQKQRDIAVKEIIEHDDGLNHVRAGNMILDLLEESTKNLKYKRERFNDRIERWKMRLKWLIYPYYGKFKTNYNHMVDRKKYNQLELHEFSSMLKIEQLRFYQENGLTLNNLRRIS